MAFVYPTGSSATMKQVEVDVGASPTTQASFTVVDADVGATSKLLVSQSGDAPTGKSADDNELDVLSLWARAAAGQFTLFLHALDGPVVGKFKVNYLIG